MKTLGIRGPIPNVQSVSYDATVKEITINFTGVTVSSNVVEDGMEVRVAIPGDTTRRYRTARVQHVNATPNALMLWEPTAGSGETVADAVDPNGSIKAGLVIYDNPSGMVDGRWDDVSYNSVLDVTEFYDAERSFSGNYALGVKAEFVAGVADGDNSDK